MARPPPMKARRSPESPPHGALPHIRRNVLLLLGMHASLLRGGINDKKLLFGGRLY